jgi:hypothetical protein
MMRPTAVHGPHAHPGIVLILRPIMIYHLLPLVIPGALAQRWSHSKED